MKGLLLISLMLASIAIPLVAARSADPRRGLRRTVWWLTGATVAYVVYLTQIHPFAFVPHWP